MNESDEKTPVATPSTFYRVLVVRRGSLFGKEEFWNENKFEEEIWRKKGSAIGWETCDDQKRRPVEWENKVHWYVWDTDGHLRLRGDNGLFNLTGGYEVCKKHTHI